MWNPTMSSISSTDQENIETIELPSSQPTIAESVTDSNMPPPKLKHMCKTNIGFVAINETKSCDDIDDKKDTEAKKV